MGASFQGFRDRIGELAPMGRSYMEPFRRRRGDDCFFFKMKLPFPVIREE